MGDDLEKQILEESKALEALDAVILQFGINRVTKMKEEDSEINKIWKAGAEATRCIKRRWRENIRKQNELEGNNKIPLTELNDALNNDNYESDEDLINESREELSTDIGAWHYRYKSDQMDDETIIQSEMDAVLNVCEENFTVVDSKIVQNITYVDSDELEEDGTPVKVKNVVAIKEEVRNFNQWSTPIGLMSEEDKRRIKTNIENNIHSTESHIGNRDIRTKLMNGKIKILPEISKEESLKRFKFTRVNTVVNDVPMCRFYINNELIYTMDIDAASSVNPQFGILEYGGTVNKMDETEKLTQVERLCYEVKRKTDINIEIEDIYGYLESGYILNGGLD